MALPRFRWSWPRLSFQVVTSVPFGHFILRSLFLLPSSSLAPGLERIRELFRHCGWGRQQWEKHLLIFDFIKCVVIFLGSCWAKILTSSQQLISNNLMSEPQQRKQILQINICESTVAANIRTGRATCPGMEKYLQMIIRTQTIVKHFLHLFSAIFSLPRMKYQSWNLKYTF